MPPLACNRESAAVTSPFLARLWTHGFNLYNPYRLLLLFHLYKRSGHAVPTHWADHRDWSSLNRQSLARTRQLLGSSPSDESGAFRHDPYGLGLERTLEPHQQWCGVDFATQEIQPHALRGEFG